MKSLVWGLALLWLGLPVWAAPSSSDFSRFASAERTIARHDRALTVMVSTLEEWLSGRQSVEATRKAVRALGQELRGHLELPPATAKAVRASQDRTVAAVEKFLGRKEHDAEGQRALLETLNSATRERATALLAWRGSTNAQLGKGAKGPARVGYLAWERRWIEIWKAEADLTFRLQKAFLSPKGGSGQPFVRELLALQSRADTIPASQELSHLSELAKKRLTLLARAAEQLDRVGSGSRGALTRLRKLGKEQAQATQELQEQRLKLLAKLALGT